MNRMIIARRGPLGLLIGIGVALGCLMSASSALAGLKVVATLPDLAAIARQIGGDEVEVSALASPFEDPHYVDPKPSHIVALNQADMLILNGLELEAGWLPPLQSQARNAAVSVGGAGVVDVSKLVRLLEKPAGQVSRAQGDIHSGGNPHYTFDPRAMAQAGVAIGNKMAELDPAHADAYRRRAVALADSLLVFAREQRARFDKLPRDKRRIVAYHGSLIYLNDWLGLDEVATIEPKPGVPPNPSHVSQVLEVVRAQRVGVILQERHYPQKTSQTLSRLAQVRLVVIDGATRFEEGEGYLDHLKRISEEVYDALDQ